MMDKELVKTIMSATAGVVKDFVAAAIAPLTDRIDELQKRLDAIRIPEAIKGERGESIKGDSGESAYEIAIKNGFEGSEKDWLESLRGEKGEDSRIAGPAGPKGDKGDSVKGDPGESIKGDPGPMGLNAYQLAQNEGFHGTRAEWLESLKGAKGDPGESIRGEKGDSVKGEPGANGLTAYQIAQNEGFTGTRIQWLESLKGRDGRDGIDGKNGESVHPDTIALTVTKEVQAAIAALPKAKDGDPGEPGRDALHIDILSEIDSKKSYARGTYAQHDGGLLKAKRRTTSGDVINLNEWEVIIRGIARLEFKQDEADPRRFVIRAVMTGDIAEESKFRIPIIIYKDRFVPGTTYERGDVVRYNRSSFVCHAEQTTGVPEVSPDWQILAERGARGNDGKNLEPPKPHTPVRLGGNGSKE